ncbi:RNA polymerase III subunit C82 [Cryptotrichosporon argae]
MSSKGKEAVRLCENIVRQAFGDVVGRVASTLLNRGRLNLRTLVRLTALPARAATGAVVVLMQHDLVLCTGASSKAEPEEEAYEFAVDECLRRLRRGRVLALTEQVGGKDAVDVVRQLFLYGKLRFGDLAALLGAADGRAQIELRRTVVRLLRGRYLEPYSRDLQMIVAEDEEVMFQGLKVHEQRATNTKLVPDKRLIELRVQAIDDVRAKRAELRDPAHALRHAPAAKKKGKERAGAGGGSAGGAGHKGFGAADDTDEWHVDEARALRVNYEKFDVLLRNEVIVKAAEDRWNRAAAEVMRAVLAATLDTQVSAAEKRTARPAGVNTIMDHLAKDAAGGVPTAKLLAYGLAGGGKMSLPELVRQYLGLMAGDGELGPGSGGQGHVVHAFLSKSEAGSSPTYLVEFDAVCAKVTDALVMELVRQRLGDKGARVLAVVMRAVNVSETMVRDCAMVPLRDARSTLSDLQKLSLIDIQEVPKTAQTKGPRFATSDFHLWRYDAPKAHAVLLANTYKTLANVLQRRAAELDARHVVLARAERPDLAGMLDLLSQKDRDDVEDVQNVVRMLALVEARTEHVVMLLRDLPGGVGAR